VFRDYRRRLRGLSTQTTRRPDPHNSVNDKIRPSSGSSGGFFGASIRVMETG
jgi:hypothetical protein